MSSTVLAYPVPFPAPLFIAFSSNFEKGSVHLTEVDKQASTGGEDPFPDEFDQAETVEFKAFPPVLEFVFTISIIFSITLLPFAFLQMFAPSFMMAVISGGFSWAFALYVLIMIIVGLKISSLFGCSTWLRITAGWHANEE